MNSAEAISLPGSSVGRFFPFDCIVASIDPQQARSVLLELQKAGFSDANSQLISGEAVTAAQAKFQKTQTADERFAPKSHSREDKYEQEYVTAARNGAATVIVRTPTTILQKRVGDMLAAHGASSIRFYHRAGIDNL